VVLGIAQQGILLLEALQSFPLFLPQGQHRSHGLAAVALQFRLQALQQGGNALVRRRHRVVVLQLAVAQLEQVLVEAGVQGDDLMHQGLDPGLLGDVGPGAALEQPHQDDGEDQHQQPGGGALPGWQAGHGRTSPLRDCRKVTIRVTSRAGNSTPNW